MCPLVFGTGVIRQGQPLGWSCSFARQAMPQGDGSVRCKGGGETPVSPDGSGDLQNWQWNGTLPLRQLNEALWVQPLS